jgi:hypothetical protein
MNARKLGEKDFDDWIRLVSGSPEGSIFSLPAYLEILCRAAGGRFSVFGAWNGGELAGGAAVYEVDSRFGVRVSPRHLLSYNSIVLRRYPTKYPSQQTARNLKTLSGLAAAFSRSGYARVTLNCRSTVIDIRPFLSAGWTATPNYTYVVPIADPLLLWEKMEQNLRRLVRRCEAGGMTATQDEDFEAFFRLHEGTMRRKGRPPYLSRPAFRNLFRDLRSLDLCRLFHARLPDGRPVATQLVLLGPGTVAHTVTAGSDPEHISTGANAFLRWEAFREISKLGYAGNDLTGAGLTPVTHFKSQLGGDLTMFLTLKSPASPRTRIQEKVEVFLGNFRKVLKKGF